MKNLVLLLPFLLLFGNAFSQVEPRLVLPVGHTSSINRAVFSPDGKLVLTASEDRTARVFEVSTGFKLLLLIGHTSILKSAVFSPDG